MSFIDVSCVLCVWLMLELLLLLQLLLFDVDGVVIKCCVLFVVRYRCSLLCVVFVCVCVLRCVLRLVGRGVLFGVCWLLFVE